MEKDKKVTKVVFRIFEDGEVIALFPEIASDSLGNCLSYMHIGQHGAADYNYVLINTKPATLEQYTPLLQELESIGYNLKIYKRRSWDMHYKMLYG